MGLKDMTVDRQNREVITEALHEVDPSLVDQARGYWAAATIIASDIVGCDIHKISDLIGAPVSFLREIEERLSAGGIWDAGGIDMTAYTGEHGGTSLLLDVNVALGQMSREWNGKEWMYKMTEAGSEHVESLLKKP